MNFGVTVTCFLTGYVLVLLLEISRWIGRIRGRSLWLIGAMGISWATHTLFFVDELFLELPSDGTPMILSSWFQWALLAAWGIATIYMALLIRRPDNAFGTFMLPLVIALIGAAIAVRGQPPFARDTTINLWGMLHGISLLVGTMVVTFGFATALMYLVQAYRLKHKLKAAKGFRLPSLEYLQSLTRACLLVSFVMLTAGLLTGIGLNLNRNGKIAWLSGGIVFTFALSAWSLAAAAIELSAKVSFGGRRTAFLSVANFLFLVLVLALVLFSPHGQNAVTLPLAPSDVNQPAQPNVEEGAAH